MTDTMQVHVCSAGMNKPCDVCEPELAQVNIRYEPRYSERTWIVVPTVNELLHICLWCGNTLRQKRLE